MGSKSVATTVRPPYYKWSGRSGTTGRRRVLGLLFDRARDDTRKMETEAQAKKLESVARTIAQSDPWHRRVLLVESDPDLQWTLARMLTVHGNRVVGTSSGEGALAVIEQWTPDLALVASSLSGVDGVDIARQLLAQNDELVVILMDESSTGTVLRETPPAVAARLAKPFRLEALRALLDKLQLVPAPAE